MRPAGQHTLGPLRQVCRECTWWGTQLARFAGALVAIDGSQGKAVNATARTCTQDKLTHRCQQIDHRIEGYRQALDGQENHEEVGPLAGRRRPCPGED